MRGGQVAAASAAVLALAAFLAREAGPALPESADVVLLQRTASLGFALAAFLGRETCATALAGSVDLALLQRAASVGRRAHDYGAEEDQHEVWRRWEEANASYLEASSNLLRIDGNPLRISPPPDLSVAQSNGGWGDKTFTVRLDSQLQVSTATARPNSSSSKNISVAAKKEGHEHKRAGGTVDKTFNVPLDSEIEVASQALLHGAGVRSSVPPDFWNAESVTVPISSVRSAMEALLQGASISNPAFPAVQGNTPNKSVIGLMGSVEEAASFGQTEAVLLDSMSGEPPTPSEAAVDWLVTAVKKDKSGQSEQTWLKTAGELSTKLKNGAHIMGKELTDSAEVMAKQIKDEADVQANNIQLVAEGKAKELKGMGMSEELMNATKVMIKELKDSAEYQAKSIKDQAKAKAKELKDLGDVMAGKIEKGPKTGALVATKQASQAAAATTVAQVAQRALSKLFTT